MEAAESGAWVEAWAGLAAEVAYLPPVPRKMLRPASLWLCLGLCSLLLGQAEAPSPVEPPERSRPYAVLRGQNLGSACLSPSTLPPPPYLLLPTTTAPPSSSHCCFLHGISSADGNHFQHPAGDCHPHGILCLQAHSASVTAKQASSATDFGNRSCVAHGPVEKLKSELFYLEMTFGHLVKAKWFRKKISVSSDFSFPLTS